jgi:hypothetical protein
VRFDEGMDESRLIDIKKIALPKVRKGRIAGVDDGHEAILGLRERGEM